MPLMKKGATATTEAPTVTVNTMEVTTQNAVVPAKRLGGTRKVGDKPTQHLGKEEYWDRKEARDIETGIRIRRSGVWQAALQSTGLLQLNTENTLEAFLALVEKTANAGLEYVNKE